jgi:TP901 family phage tail tape measure protein
MSINLNVTGNTQPLEAAVNAAINRIRKTPIKITVDDKGATQPLGNMKRGADEFSKSMEAANSRIIAFGASMAIINGVADGFKALVKNVVEVEKALADINVVMNLSTANLEKFSNGLFKTAKETGAAFNIAAEAATEYARQGLTMEESLKRTRDALILTRLTGMDSANAVKALTAAMNTYGDQIKDTTQLVSKFAAVDVKFAVSAEDFADAISRTGQAARSAGVDIDELVGLVTAAQQKTARGGKVIGNSFKTIFTRIGRTDTLNQLENLGIAVRDLEGNTIGARRILTDLANTFDHLTESQKAQIAQTVGGVFQINILKAVLSDAAKQNGILANATQISAGATTEAIDKNDQLRQTMSAMATETGLALKELSAQIGEIMLAPGMEKVLNVFKGLAEGANEMLGGGESTGSDFAQGFLKGLGNIITGPGLVVISAVFIKLFAKALVYANQSLKSLIGVTSEAHKQKAIQTSLVTLFGQNAAISKEMLRTDISRTEKEKIILGLLKAQVVEANMLNSVSKSVAASLYTKGYNASLAPRKGRSGGHIPNFADPERAQAARGGYAAGTIRSMDMPGQGSVIYNSAEKVKNFKGMSQPAIMPPHSSKAGKNYQQAFGDVHGFDPYAAGGYIPNYAKSGAHIAKSDGRSIINDDKSMVVFAASTDRGGKYAGINDEKNNIFSIKPKDKGFVHSSDPMAGYSKGGGVATDEDFDGFSLVNVPYFGISEKDKQIGEHKDFQSLINKRLIDAGRKVAGEISTKIFGKNYSVRKLEEGDVAAASGNVFEAAIMALQDTVAEEARKKDPGKNSLLDIPRPGRNKLWDIFGAGGFGSGGAEAKIALGGSGKIGSHLKSAAEKFYKIETRGADAFTRKKTTGSKTSGLQGFINQKGGEKDSRVGKGKSRMIANWPTSREGDLDSLRAEYDSLPKNRAYGHIPNFADPLSDAIGRETAAGVPVSQIRVGSHPALMGKSNPIGLGVTNTHDEPNGLRDVIGAAGGFVPNYASQDFQGKDLQGQGISKTQRKRLAKSINGQIKSGTLVIKSQQEFAKELKKLHPKLSLHARGISKADVEIQKNTATRRTLGSRLKASAKSVGSGVSGAMGAWGKANSKFEGTRIGKAIGSNAGQMGLMMGAPMLGGMLQQGQAGETPQQRVERMKGGTYQTGGAMVGVGTGAAMGMMLGPLGSVIGGVIGGVMGFAGALEDAEKAALQLAESQAKANAAGMMSSISLALQALPPKTLNQFGPELKVLAEGTNPKNISDNDTFEQVDLLKKMLSAPEVDQDKKIKIDEKVLETIGLTNTGGIATVGQIGKSVSGIKEKIRKQSDFDKNLDGSAEEGDLKANQSHKKELQEGLLTLLVALNADTQISAQAEKANSQAVIKRLNLQRAGLKFQEKLNKDLSLMKIKSQKSLSIYSWVEKFGLQGNAIISSQIKFAKAMDKLTKDMEISNFSVEQKQVIGAVDMISKSTGSNIDSDLKQFLSNPEKMSGITGIDKQTLDHITQLRELTDADYTTILPELNYDQVLEVLEKIGETNRDALDVRTKMIDKTELEKKALGRILKEKSSMLIIDNKINSKHSERLELQKSITREISAQNEKIKSQNAQIDISRKIADLKFKNANPYATKKQQTEYDIGSQEQRLNQDLLTDSAASSRRIADKIEDIYKKLGSVAPKSLLDARARGDMGKVESEISEKKLRPLLTDKNLNAKKQEMLKTRVHAENFLLSPEQLELIKTEYEGYKNQGADMTIGKPLGLTNQLNSHNEAYERVTEIKKQSHELDKLAKMSEKQRLKLVKELLGNLDESIVSEKDILKLKKQNNEEAKKAAKLALPGGSAKGFARAKTAAANRLDFFDETFAEDMTNNFRDGLVDGMQAAINKADDLSDVMNNIAMNFLGAIQQAYLGKAADAIVGALPFSSGGGVRKYSKGGGVPAMVTDGEYVMGRDAVKKYGGGFMHRLNAGGKLPGYSNGGKPDETQPGSALAANFGGGEGYNTGRRYQTQAMSGFFYSGQSGNLGLQEDTQYTKGIIQERMRKEAEKKAKKRALMQMIVGTALSVGIGSLASAAVGGGGLTANAKADGYTNATPAGVKSATQGGMKYSLLPGADATGFDNVQSTRSFNPFKVFGSSSVDDYGSPLAEEFSSAYRTGAYRGGKINGYANGGHISGKSGIDQIPAMLSEGEYVVRASSARQLGKPMLDRINAGKFNDGGAVTPLTESSETGTSGGNTNNINITVNMDKGSGKSEKKDDKGGANPKDSSADQEKSSQLAEKVKSQVISVIMEEQRPGGLLSD